VDFAQVEERVAKLRQSLAAGHMTEDQFKFQLREMMVEDEDGNWWMVGYETGQWYRHDGTDWVRANPPKSLITRPLPRLNVRRTTSAEPRPRQLKGVVVFVLGTIVTGVVGLIAGQFAFETLFDHNDTMTWIFASVVWIIGLVVTVVVARKA
jgi:hypothetical protein